MAELVWPAAYRDIITAEQIRYMLDWMYSPEALTREIRGGEILYFWIETPDRVGFLSVGPVKKGATCHLHKCYVLPEYHRTGIGSMAFAALVALLTRAEVSGVELRVNRHNEKAIAFYRKNDFELLREDCADIGGGFEMDDFILYRSLKQH